MQLERTLERVKAKECSIEIFGLGYVGFPLSVRLAISGFKAIGVDNDSQKIERIQKGILEGTELLLKSDFIESQKREALSFSKSSKESALPRIGIICVPTPIPNKNIRSDAYVRSAVEDFVDSAKSGDIIIIESSIEVGTTEEMEKVIESKGFKVGLDFGLSFCPERIDPLNTKWKLENITRVISCSDDLTFQITQQIYHHVNNSNLVRVKSAKIAEVVKSFENAFRLVNISLVNELAILCDKLKISVQEVLDAASTKPFGFMPFYPSAGAGGHCIPKDPLFLLESAKKFGLNFETIDNAIKVNTFIPRYIVEEIEKTLQELKLAKSVLVCGLSYKPNIEDMRDSPGFKIINELKKRNFRIGSYDPHFKDELIGKYLKENNITEKQFEKLDNLDDKNIKDFSCICIVQHHAKTKFRLEEIYKNSAIPFIYDCQNQLVRNSHSKSILKQLGS